MPTGMASNWRLTVVLMQAEPVDVGAQGLARCALARHRTPQAQHLQPGAGPEGDAVGDGRGLQRPQRARLLAVGIRLGQVGLAHLLDQHAPAREQLHQPQHALLARQMKAASGLLLAFGVKGGAAADVRFIEAAQFMNHLVNIGDARTLISHPASTTHRQLSEDQQRAAGVTPEVVRIPVGLEHVDDILWDIDQALAAASA